MARVSRLSGLGVGWPLFVLCVVAGTHGNPAPGGRQSRRRTEESVMPTYLPTSLPAPTGPSVPSYAPTIGPSYAPTSNDQQSVMPTHLPSTAPTSSPAPTGPIVASYAPTIAPSYAPTSNGPQSFCSQMVASTSFESIADEPGVVRLEEVSSNDDAAELVQLPFEFPWFSSILTSVIVSSNGQINMDGNDDHNCCDADTITPDSGYTGDRIAIAQEDLSPSERGDIFFLDKGASVVISFEGVPFFVNEGEVNAQVELFDTGEIELRWGSGSTADEPMAAGVQSDFDGVYAPVESAGGATFVDGVTSTWPSNDGVAFSCESVGVSSPPSTMPSIMPSPAPSPMPSPLPTPFLMPGSLVQTALCTATGCSASTTFNVSDDANVTAAMLDVFVGGSLMNGTITLTINDVVVETCGEFVEDCNDPLEICVSNLDVSQEVLLDGRVTVAFNTSSFVSNICEYEGMTNIAAIAVASLNLTLSDTGDAFL